MSSTNDTTVDIRDYDSASERSFSFDDTQDIRDWDAAEQNQDVADDTQDIRDWDESWWGRDGGSDYQNNLETDNDFQEAESHSSHDFQAQIFQDTESDTEDENYEQHDPLRHVSFAPKVECNVAPRFGLKGASYSFKFKDQDQIVNAEEVARAALNKVLENAFSEATERDLVGVSIMHPSLDHEILIHFGDRDQTTAQKVFDTISCVQQSKKDLDFDGAMNMKVTRITPPEGRGNPKLAKGRFEEMFQSHSGGHGSAFIRIRNDDWMCFARAVVVARARYQYKVLGDTSVKWQAIRKGDKYKLQKTEALHLMMSAGLLGHKNSSCGVEEMKKIQKCLVPKGFQLKVFSKDHFDARIFDDELVGPAPLHIYHHDDHYTVLKSPRFLTGSNYFCDFCNRGYDRIEEHKCPNVCPCCKSTPPCRESTNYISCQECSRRFKSQTCFDNHKQRSEKYVKAENSQKRKRVLGESVCMKLKLCVQCGRCMRKSILLPEKHKCGFRYCSTCKTWVKNKELHQCFMQPLKTKKRRADGEEDLLPEELETDMDDIDALIREEEDRQGETESSRQAHFRKSGQGDCVQRYIFWDFETIQQDEVNWGGAAGGLGPSYLHKPMYCIARKVCMSCKDFWLERCQNPECKLRSCEECNRRKPNCQFCKDHHARFSGDKCRDEFCDYLFREQHRGTIAIAHNAKGFDAQFIMQWCFEQKRVPKIIPRGLQILSLECMGVKIKDSFCFISQSLASLPKTFNEPELKKGYFPYLFYRRENWDYVGAFPDADQYCPSQMKPETRDAFYKWYNEHKGRVFDLQKELMEYTESDVDILLRCMMKFNDLFFSQTGVYPLESAVTIAQVCNQVFRRTFLKENTIGVVPTGGYRGNERQSNVALEWLKWLSHKHGLNIQHARNGKEKVIGGYKADGYIHATNTVLEFHGCIFHGCPKHCKHRDRKVPNSSLTYEEVYQRTLKKSIFLKSQGYNLIEIWECEWSEQKRKDPEIGTFLDTLDFSQFLDARGALAGGRTNATVLWRKCKRGEKIFYYDVCSLYPWVCKYCAFPLKHPRVITENFQKISKGANPYFGLIKCRVLPPRNLLHPLLPYKYNDRLNFILCRTCLEQNQEGKCEHSEVERSFTAEFVSVEIDKALTLGYQIKEIFEVWHYDEKAEYDGVHEESGLFTSYINRFLKLKQEKSGWPCWVKTEADKDQYILEYEQKEGITLDPSEVDKNNGLRTIAKMCLNTLWGKFAQKSDQNTIECFTEPNKFFDVVFDEENIVSTVRSLGEDMVGVTYKKEEIHERVNPNISVVIAAFVTAHARLRLYSYIEKLNERTLYFDTDSVIFITRPEDSYMPPLGDHLGDLTDELSEYGQGCFISEFVSTGPKAYSFRVVNPVTRRVVKTVTKVKGFSLNYANAAHINFKRMKKQVKDYVQNNTTDEVTVYGPQIQRKKNHVIVTAPTKKVQKVVYCKRVVRSDFTTVPFGYIH